MVNELSATVTYVVPRSRAGWELSEETMPESFLHDEVVSFLRALLTAWAARSGRGLVTRNIAVRWDQARPQVGVDPDLAVLDPPPPEGRDVRSVRLWEPGHVAPRLAIEVVSETNPRKDYLIAPDKYAASGTRELWIFDPLLAGPPIQGGPHRLQLWQRDDAGAFTRTYAGEGPVFSDAVHAHLVVVDEGRKLRIAGAPDLTGLWLTAEEQERAAKEEERAAKEEERAAREEERAAKEEALARVALLEAELARRPK